MSTSCLANNVGRAPGYFGRRDVRRSFGGLTKVAHAGAGRLVRPKRGCARRKWKDGESIGDKETAHLQCVKVEK